MPFSGPGDSSLPANVRKMPQGKRAQWVNIFNSVLKKCMKGKTGANARKTCETNAFRQANGAVKDMEDTIPVQCPSCKEWTKTIPSAKSFICNGCQGTVNVVRREEFSESTDAEEGGEKCGPVEVMYNPPMGGATTFAGVDSYMQAREQEMHISDLQNQFDVIVRNIMADDDMALAEKASAVEVASRELAKRVKAGDKGLMAKFREWITANPQGGEGEEKSQTRFTTQTGKSWQTEEPVAEGPEKGAFYVTKDAKGAWRWLAVTTNKFFDREDEAFSEASHQEYEEYVDKSQDYPEAWLWHTPGTRFGQADFVAYHDGFLLTSGTFDKGMEEVAERLASTKERLGVSHGFLFPEGSLDEEGVYHKYRMQEVSPLPMERAANVWTEFAAQLKESAMALSPEKRKFLVDVLGEGRTATIEGNLSDVSKELEEAGVGWKELGDGLAVEEKPPAEEEKPEEEAPAGEKPAGEEEKPESEEGEQSPESDPNVLDGLVKAMDEIRKGLAQQGKSLDEQFGGIGERLSALELTDDQKIAAAIAPRNKPNGAAGPANSDANEIPEAQAKKMTKTEGSEDPPSNPATPYVEDAVGRQVRGQ